MIVDVVVVLLVLVLGLRGLRRGFVRELFSFAGWLAGSMAAVWFLYDLTPPIAERLQLPAAVAGLIAFVGVFVAVSTAFWIVGWLLGGLIRVTVILRPVDRVFGAVLGVGEGLIFAGILVFVFRESPLFPAAREQIEASTLSKPLAEHVSALFASVRDEALKKSNAEPPTEPPRRRPRTAPKAEERL